MIRFIIQEEKPKAPLYVDVKPNQFFISTFGSLCQKINNRDYVRIADEDKKPNCATFLAVPEMEIQKILPETIKIEF